MKTISLPDNLRHEACNKTIDDLLKLVASQRKLLESMTATPYMLHLLAALPRRNEWVFSSPTTASA